MGIIKNYLTNFIFLKKYITTYNPITIKFFNSFFTNSQTLCKLTNFFVNSHSIITRPKT